MDQNSFDKILKYLNRHKSTLDDTFKLIIIDLLTETNFDYYKFRKILNGAFIIIKDNGYFYKKWVYYHKQVLKKRNKILEPILDNILNSSSHYSCNNQYRLGNGIIYDINDDLTNTFDLLIGTSCLHKNNICKKNKKCHTWFQLERSRISSLYNMMTHVFDYINYKISGRNIGPFGESEHTEFNDPIMLELKKALI